MQLFVVRHAIAEDTADTGLDADRELTKAGARKFRRNVRGLRALKIRFDRIVTSPWSRARATAKLLAKLTERGTPPPVETEWLCRSPRTELFDLLGGTPSADSDRCGTAVVGHEPWLGELVAWLAFGDTRHGEALALKKGGVVWLAGSVAPGGMTIRALLPPRVLSAL
jgi:phosphohistidine phosphatase